MKRAYDLYTDGGARGNPGPAALGVVIKDAHSGAIIAELKEYLGSATNNQAEYRALLAALSYAREQQATHIVCYLDSELIVKQMNRQYRVKNKNLAQLYLAAWKLASQFSSISFHHIPRAQNSAADRLVNQALDEHEKKQYTS